MTEEKKIAVNTQPSSSDISSSSSLPSAVFAGAACPNLATYSAGAPAESDAEWRRAAGFSAVRGRRTSDPLGVALGFPHHERGGLAVQWVGRVGVEEQLRQENVEDIQQVCARRVARARRAGRLRAQSRGAPNIGLHVWLMTSRHTEPDLREAK